MLIDKLTLAKKINCSCFSDYWTFPASLTGKHTFWPTTRFPEHLLIRSGMCFTSAWSRMSLKTHINPRVSPPKSHLLMFSCWFLQCDATVSIRVYQCQTAPVWSCGDKELYWPTWAYRTFRFSQMAAGNVHLEHCRWLKVMLRLCLLFIRVVTHSWGSRMKA